ncbi:hypothetical protein [Morganella morganii]|uniref:hypothetical protein n=1 Tax=Morganella morganii TaxID=582 RepID=UPI00259F1C21|nr:hypothetical protein [Morganella morganii]WOZ89232.1 hypothetical protein PSP90_04810 [Morganella morganii]
MKIKRKIHNKLFPTRRLAFYQHSVMSDDGYLECYYDKWFLVLSFLPVLFIGTFMDGFPRAWRAITPYFTDWYSMDGLTKEQIQELKELQK